MCSSKVINKTDYQSCGEIMVAVKKNKFAMSCKFCSELFTQLQAFMRHLQLHHNNELEFVKQAKEVEVYAVEELMNQTTASFVPDVESEESNLPEGEDNNWLSEQDMNWLKNGEEPKTAEKLPQQEVKNDERSVDKGLSLANMSILKALEDCDVSFNLMDELNSTKCGEDKEETNLDNTLLREIENDWYDSDSNDCQPNKIDCSQVVNMSKQILDLTTDLELDVTMSDLPLNSTCVQDKLESDKNNIEGNSNNGIKGLLEGLEDMNDIDDLLEKLESDSASKIEENAKIIQVKEEKLTKDKNMLQENKILKGSQNKESLFKEDDFEKRLKQLENDLENDTEDISNMDIIKATASEENPKPKKEFSEKLKDLEDSLIDCPIQNKVRKNNEYNTKSTDSIKNNKNLNITNDFKLQLQNLEDSLDFEEIEQHVSSKALNEDLTRALADALDDENLDLLYLPTEKEKKETLSSDLLRLLDRELMDTENEINVVENDSKLLKNTENVTVIKNLNNSKKQTKSLNIENNIKLKYQKTNVKAKSKLLETKTKNVLKPSNKSSILKDSNTQSSVKILNAQQFPLKGNHEIFMQQKQLSSLNNSLKSPAKRPATENINGQMLINSRYKKTPNKENRENKTPILNIRNIKQEKLTPATVFVNTDRGDKTPLKQEKLFLKQSPKTQEKEEILKDNVTPKRGNKTPQERTIKQSPRTQEKQQHINNQQTPKVARQKTPQLKETRSVKQSPKAQEKRTFTENTSNKSPKTPETNKEQLKMSTKKSSQTSNEKRNSNSNSSPTQQISKNSNSSNYMGDTKTPLTTPQRLRNVAIKLQRFTPDKLYNKQQKSENNTLQPSPKSTEDETRQLIEQFKLPKGISLSKIPKQNSAQDINQSEIIETPVKATFCKQNFNESSLDPIESHETKNESSNDASPTNLIPLQNNVIDHLKRNDNNSKLRQRKASIDIVSKPVQQSVNKTPRHSNLDYKSYAVNRSARKKEVLQRMRHIKKQIFKSIEGGEFITRVKHVKSPLIKSQKKRKIFIENVQILPKLKQETLTPLINPFNDFKKPLDNTPVADSQTGSPKNVPDDQKQANKILDVSKIDSPINDDEKLIKKSLKRPATSPLLNEEKQAKRQQTSPAKEQQISAETPWEMETTQLDLSESVVDFLQRDLRANRLNVDSFLNEELPVDDCTPDETSLESNAKDTKLEEKSKESESKNNSNLINDLLNQVDNEHIPNEKTQKEASNENDGTLNNDDVIEDFDENRDIQLLAKFGLKIVKFPDIEDSICIEERDKMNEKAMKFSKIYHNYPRVWSSKNSEVSTFKEELDTSFKQLQQETNICFNVDLRLEEIKRLTNLINIWYSHNCNNKLIEKRKISEATNRYLLIFHYIPKTTKRFFYCEYCKEHFNTEHKYFTHRIIHTGALYPYKCRKCCAGFKNVKHLKNHETVCDINTDNNSIDKLKPNTYERSKTRSHKCMMCAEIFETSEDLYEHSKKHLKTIYNCAKCELVFASAIDVQNHMSICNTVAKRIPKQCTPRPQKTKSEALSKNLI